MNLRPILGPAIVTSALPDFTSQGVRSLPVFCSSLSLRTNSKARSRTAADVLASRVVVLSFSLACKGVHEFMTLLHKQFIEAVKIGFLGTDVRPVAAFRS